jgi:hypothetical protein
MKNMSIKHAAIIILAILLLTVVYNGLQNILCNGRTALINNYQKDDTTITCKNGRCDTVIVKGHTPDWLK